MKNGIIYFISTLLAYVAILYFVGEYQLSAYIYHTLLLAFPIALVLTKRDNTKLLGLVKGKWKLGLSITCIVIAMVFFIFWLRYKELFTSPTFDSSLALIVIYSPIAEELFFRGYFQPKLEGRFGKWIGLVITAVLFMVIHLPKVFLIPLTGPTQLLSCFILGIVFGIVRDESQSLYYPILCHAGYNVVAAFFISAV